jgi:Na+-transporting NADH:ubiquinone oxidoreductase subunit NqrB
LASPAGSSGCFKRVFLVTFVRNGFEVLAASLRAGKILRPDTLIAVPAALGTAGLVVFSAVGYVVRRQKSWRDVVAFAAAFILVALFFVAIFAAFAPQFLIPLHRFVAR